jgi:hypothetical protein
VLDEIVTYYCPNCLFEVPSSTVKSEGTRYDWISTASRLWTNRLLGVLEVVFSVLYVLHRFL